MRADDALARLGVPQAAAAPSSYARFPDGAAFRIEIPSVEGPRVLATVLRAAGDENVIVNRVSQGSGAMLRRTGPRRPGRGGPQAGERPEQA